MNQVETGAPSMTPSLLGTPEVLAAGVQQLASFESLLRKLLHGKAGAQSQE